MSTPEFPQDLLDAAESVVKSSPGITSPEVAHAVPTTMMASGHPGVIMSRDKAKALLRVLEEAGRVTRRTEQARVGFYPAEKESADAE